MGLENYEDRKKMFMLCNSIDEENALKLDEANYQANIKFDGENIMAIVLNDDVILWNRRGRICNMNFPEIVEDLKKLPNCLINGEVISVDDDFTLLQKRALTKTLSKIPQLVKDIPLKFMIFDVLGVGDNATNKIDLPLRDRIVEMKNLFSGIELEYTELAEYKPIEEILKQSKEENREGIVVKDLNGKYMCGKRHDNWKKLKFWLETDIIVTSYTENPSGIRVETSDGNIACQIAGEQHKEVKEILDEKGQVEITIQYLSKNEETGKFRFPSFKRLLHSDTIK